MVVSCVVLQSPKDVYNDVNQTIEKTIDNTYLQHNGHLTIYTEKPKIPVAKLTGLKTRQIMGILLRSCILS